MISIDLLTAEDRKSPEDSTGSRSRVVCTAPLRILCYRPETARSNCAAWREIPPCTQFGIRHRGSLSALSRAVVGAKQTCDLRVSSFLCKQLEWLSFGVAGTTKSGKTLQESFHPFGIAALDRIGKICNL